MSKPLMPKATAVWLVDNTALSFDQVGAFCDLHPLEVQGIADGEVAQGIQGQDPIQSGELTRAEIERCEKDPTGRLKMAERKLPEPKRRTKGPRYTPVAKRHDKPNGIAWLVKNHPKLADSQISRLIGTTKTTIAAIRDRSHWNIANIQPGDPVLLGLCTQNDLNNAIAKVERAEERAKKAAEKEARKAAAEKAAAEEAAAKKTKAAPKPEAATKPEAAPESQAEAGGEAPKEGTLGELFPDLGKTKTEG